MRPPAGTPDPEPRPWRLLDAAAAFGGGVLAATVAFLIIGVDAVDGAALFGVIVPAQALGMLVVVALIARRRPPWREALRWSGRPSDLIGLLVGAGAQVAASIVIGLLVELSGWELPTQEVVDRAATASGAEWLLVVLGVAVLAPLSEEVVFRGVALRAIEGRRGRRAAVYGSAALFALVHLLDPGALVAVPVFFLLGVILGNEVIRTGRLGRAIAIHAGFNLVTVLALVIA